jgi:propanediol dehydratase small subunit
VSFDPRRDYPLGSALPDLVRSPTGIPLADLVLDGDVTAADLRASSETLRMQAEVARAAERPRLADNLTRAAELASVPDDAILDVYTALRPRRSTAEELEGWAARLEELGAPANAAFVREAAEVYALRGLLRVE